MFDNILQKDSINMSFEFYQFLFTCAKETLVY